MNRAIIYARNYPKAHERKEELIEIQLQQARDYASRKGYEVVAEFTDCGVPSYSTDRPEFATMLATLSITKPNAIIVTEVSRISRKIGELLRFEEQMKREGIQVLIAKTEM